MYQLALAVLRAQDDLEDFGKANFGTLPLPPEPMIEILEKNLKDFLHPGWRRQGHDEEQQIPAGQKKLEAEIIELGAEIRRRARRA